MFTNHEGGTRFRRYLPSKHRTRSCITEMVNDKGSLSKKKNHTVERYYDAVPFFSANKEEAG